MIFYFSTQKINGKSIHFFIQISNVFSLFVIENSRLLVAVKDLKSPGQVLNAVFWIWIQIQNPDPGPGS